MAPSSCRDRTREFDSIVDSLRKSHASLPISNGGGSLVDGPSSSSSLLSSSSLPRHPSMSVQSEFNHRASAIGLSIHQTSQKLSKLAKLAKRTSMFDDPAVEIQELTAVIKQDITALNADIADLQSFCDTQNGIGSGVSKQSNEHSTTVVGNLKSRLMNATKEFKEVLTLRTENLKVHENRRQMYSSAPGKERENTFIRHRASASTSTSAMSSSAAPPPWATDSASSSPLLGSRRQLNVESSQQQALVPVQDNYMQNRAEALQNVESTILELSNIFTQLATMVAQQGEVAIRIDENIEDTLANVEGAQGALLKYLNSISSNRWLIIKIFCVLVVFMLIFVVFVA